MAHSFEAAVVEVEMGKFDFVRVQAFGIDCEAVVVRGDFDSAAASVLDRLIAAAMAEFEFECVTAEGPAQQLVSQTDAEDRRGAEKAFYLADDLRQRRRVAGAV